jgi:hypothetical protein
MAPLDAACNVVYVDRTALKERLVCRDEYKDKPVLTIEERLVDGEAAARESVRTLESNIKTLLETFSTGACERALANP